MKLTCYAIRPDAPVIRAAPTTRAWMDRVIDNHAYRCLPLNIANSHGWEILCPLTFSATWSGDIRPEVIKLQAQDTNARLSHCVVSHFGYGIISFHLGYLFRTEPGWDLVASGSFNSTKHGIAPLTGVMETSWLPYPFTMSWQMTQPGTVRFEKGEPICMIFPVPHGALQEVEPEIVGIDAAPELKAQMEQWQHKRADFMRQLYREPKALKDAWLRDYFLGRMPDGSSPAEHLPKLRLAAPIDRRAGEPGKLPG
jgi:Family of unknown function (DUF6065)